jgi:hypothetical protein
MHDNIGESHWESKEMTKIDTTQQHRNKAVSISVLGAGEGEETCRFASRQPFESLITEIQSSLSTSQQCPHMSSTSAATRLTFKSWLASCPCNRQHNQHIISRHSVPT